MDSLNDCCLYGCAQYYRVRGKTDGSDGREVSTGQETAEAVSTEDSKDMFNESGQLPILKEKRKLP